MAATFLAADFFDAPFLAFLTVAAVLRASSPAAHSLVVWSSITASAASFRTDLIPLLADALELYASLVATI